jgi:hypothetical protein
MIKTLAFAFLISYALSASGQDTIFTLSEERLLVRVLEISATEVTYKNFYNPDGILRKVGSGQVKRIVYENGKEEALFQLKEKTAASVKPHSLFVIEGRHIALNNVDITHKEAMKMMLQRDVQQNSEDLNLALIEAESKKTGQIAFNILGPTALVGGLYLARRNRYNDPREKLRSKAFIISGLSVCVVSLVAAQVYKSVKNNRIRKAALLYNSEI